MIKSNILMFKRLALLMIGVISFIEMSAQDSTKVLNLSLKEALEISLEKNPTLRVADEEINLKETANREAWQSLLPSLMLNGGLDHTINAPQMTLNGQTFKMGKDNSNTVNAGISLNLPLFAPAVYKTMALSKTDIKLAYEKSRASKIDLINQVTKAYFQLLLAQDSHLVLKGSYKLSQENYDVVASKYEQGSVSEFDKISAEVQMRSIKPNLIAAENAVELAKLQLKVLMGIKMEFDLSVSDDLGSYESELFANELQADQYNLENNTTMRQLELNHKMLRQNLSLAKSAFLPNLSMSLAAKYQSLNNDNLNMFDYSWSHSSNLMVNLSIPIFQASNFTKVKTAKIQLAQLKYNTVNTERNLKMQVDTYRKNMRKSSEQVVSNRENVMQAKKAVQIANKRYEVGKGTVLELNSSQVALTQAELTYNQSIYDYLVAKADLEKVIGNNLNIISK